MLKDKVQTLVDLTIPPFSVVPVTEKDGFWIDKVLADAGVKLNRIPMDNKYLCASMGDIGKIAAWDWASRKAYISEVRDCDKFARWFWARSSFLFRVNNVGFVDDYSSGHAYNIIVAPDGSIYLYEPQNDALWPLSQHSFTDPYKMQLGIILI